jgi:NADH-quinone oxidoreductase subunit N
MTPNSTLFVIPDFGPALAEIVLLVAASLILIVDLFIPEKRKELTFSLCLAALASVAAVTAFMTPAATVITFEGAFILDPLARVLKLFTYAVVAVVFIYSREYLKERGSDKGEYYLLGLFATLGIMVLISAHNLLSLYLGLELLSLSLYAMVAFDRNNPVAAEAAMKYFVLGAIASGCFLFGASILYGMTGSLDLAVIRRALESIESGNLQILFAMSFILVGIAFKFGAVPFHMWVPDVYQGAPTSVTLFIGSAAKLGSFAMLLRVIVEGMGDLQASWSGMLIVMAVLSMLLGNLVAIAQTNLKRMLAYSTISHVGFILMGVLAGNPEGTQAALFYTISYVIMAMVGFGMILLLSRRGFEAEELDDLKGLNKRSPWFAGIMLIAMFSMAGVPPFLGFYAKLAVLGAAINAGLMWLAIAGVLFSVIGAFYYLRVVKLMYFDESDGHVAIDAGLDMRLVLSLNGLLVLLLGLFPDGLIALCNQLI